MRVRSDDELDRELNSGEHDEATRTAIMVERFRRVSQTRSRPHWIHWTTLAVALVGAALEGGGAWPVISDFGEKEWFDF